MQRELPKLPELPDNFNELIDQITEICFIPFENKKVDVVFAFGNWTQAKEIASIIEKLYNQNVSTHFILTGGLPTFEYSHLEQISVADKVHALLSEDLRKNCQIDIQNTSLDSIQDVTYAMPFLEPFKKSKIGCVACNWAFGRQIRYLEKFMPEAIIYSMPYEAALTSDQKITSENWHQNEEYRKRLWGEIIRYKLYGERGDMAYPDELCAKIDRIFSKIKPQST